MIAYLDGVVSEVRQGSVIMQAGAFGLEVYAPKSTLMACQVGSALRLHTHLVVKEDDLSLYGFHQADMLRLFGYLVSVSGVGAKLGSGNFVGVTHDVVSESHLRRRRWLTGKRPGSRQKTGAAHYLRT